MRTHTHVARFGAQPVISLFAWQMSHMSHQAVVAVSAYRIFDCALVCCGCPDVPSTNPDSARSRHH